MGNKEQILSELREISPFLADLGQVNPYTLPDGYFEALPDRITEKILLTASLQPGFSNTNCYQVPGSYFDNLSDTILSAIKMGEQQSNEVNAELALVTPLLNTISKEQVYNVPESYFDREISGSSLQPKKKDVGVFNIRSVRKWMQYAAAAVVAGVLITGAFLYTDSSENYIEYEKYNQVDIRSALDKVSEEELLRYLDSPEHTAIMPAVNLSASEAELFDMNSSMQAISDEELKQYLKENTGLSDTIDSDKTE